MKPKQMTMEELRATERDVLADLAKDRVPIEIVEDGKVIAVIQPPEPESKPREGEDSRAGD